MIRQGDIISYWEMCHAEGRSLQQGMNFRPSGRQSIVLMSLRRGAPYADRVEEEGKVLIYEGHNRPKSDDVPDPKMVDQVETQPDGRPTQNGLFLEAAERYKLDGGEPERVRVYEKLRPSIWTYNGVFSLVDAWDEPSGDRKVFKFRLELLDDPDAVIGPAPQDLAHTRLIPSDVKLEVWKRDGGACVLCGSRDNLHFDHDLPFSKGGSSLTAMNIRLLCERHNLAKSDRIE